MALESFGRARRLMTKRGLGRMLLGGVWTVALLGMHHHACAEDVHACWYGSAGLHGALAYNDVNVLQKITNNAFDDAQLLQQNTDGEGARFRLTLGGGYQFKPGAFLGLEFIAGVGDVKTLFTAAADSSEATSNALVRPIVTQKESLGVQLLFGWTLDWAQPYLQGAWTNSRFVLGQGKTVTKHKHGWTVGAGVDCRVLPHLYLGASVARTYYQDIHIESTHPTWFGTEKDYVRFETATNEIALHVKVKT